MSKSKIILAALVWLVVLAVGVSIWKFVIEPMRRSAAKEAQQAEESEILKQSTGNSIYKNNIAIGLDAFSGYAVLRSQEFADLLAQQQIKVNIVDDGADYAARLEGLRTGELQMAAFPIDALIKASAQANALPATIIGIIDESYGADAIVAYKEKYPNLAAINTAETRFVLVGDSPSETLAHVVMQEFDLPTLGRHPFTLASSGDDVLSQYRAAGPTSPNIYVTWEPYVSEMLQNDAVHVLTDSSKQSGYIVDAMVVSRDFLVKNRPIVEQVLEAYFTAYHKFRDDLEMEKLVVADAATTGTKLTPELAKTIVAKIDWKNTQMNFAHFGLRQGEVVHLETMIERITKVLLATEAIQHDPTDGQAAKLFFDPPLAQLQTRNFHPGLASEQLSEQRKLAKLTDDEWNQLVPVAKLKVRELVFSRGSARLTDSSRGMLDELAEKLQSWPDYYLIVRGSTTQVGDPEKNLALANERALAAQEYLHSVGIPLERMRVVTDTTLDRTLVTFEAVEQRY